MRNREKWKPSKFIRSGPNYGPNMDPTFVAVSSRFIVSILADVYERLIATHTRGLLLDLGCGYAPCYEMYKNHTTDNICVDWPNTLHKSPYLDVEVDLNNTFPFRDDCFDTILCTDVLEHIAKPEPLMAEITRVLNPNGKLILAVPFFYWIHEAPFDYYRYTQYALRKFCEDYKLLVVEIAPYGGASDIVLDILMKTMPKRIVTPSDVLARKFSRSKVGRKLSHRTEARFPLGFSLVAQKPGT